MRMFVETGFHIVSNVYILYTVVRVDTRVTSCLAECHATLQLHLSVARCCCASDDVTSERLKVVLR